MNKILFLSIILFTMMVIPSCGNNGRHETTDEEPIIPQKTIPELLQEATNVQEIPNLIDGTTWHYTENLNNSEIGGWLQVTFNNGQYITYYANPTDGKWTEGGRGQYDISEGRYSNTGEKYYGISWNGDMKFDWATIPCEMTMTINNDGIQLNVTSSFMKGLNSLTMGVRQGAYYNATHNQVYKGKMEFGEYSWD